MNSALYLLGLLAAFIFGWQAALVAAVLTVRRRRPGRPGDPSRPGRPGPATITDHSDLVIDLTVRPRQFDWQHDDPHMAACGLCDDTGHATYKDKLTGVIVVDGVCPCGKLPIDRAPQAQTVEQITRAYWQAAP